MVQKETNHWGLSHLRVGAGKTIGSAVAAGGASCRFMQAACLPAQGKKTELHTHRNDEIDRDGRRRGRRLDEIDGGRLDEIDRDRCGRGGRLSEGIVQLIRGAVDLIFNGTEGIRWRQGTCAA